MKILVIEDDYSSSIMFQRYLENYGKCETVSTGFDGMQKYIESISSGQQYNLIIIDIILPDMNGYEVLETIRAEEDARKYIDAERTKIILTTSLDDEENRKLAEKLTPGLETYYTKKFVLEGFDEKLQELGLQFV